MGDSSPHWRGPTGWGDGESYRGRGSYLWSAYAGIAAANRAHRPTGSGHGGHRPGGGRCLKCACGGMAAPDRAGPKAGRTGGTAQAVAVA